MSQAETKLGTNPPDPRQYEPLYGLEGLIDGDIIAYRCAFAAEKTFYLVAEDATPVNYESHRDIPKAVPKECIWSRKEVGPVEFALQATKTTLDAILSKTRASSVRIYLSGKNNFRYDVAVTKPYKAGRETVAKPTHWRAVREFLITQYGAEVVDGYEADDAIGIASTGLGKSAFICTIDKDLDQLSGLHYNWVRDEVYDVSRRDADFNLYAQVLSGDGTDNIPGLDGIGPVKARKLLDQSGSTSDLFQRAWGAFRAGSNPDVGKAWDYFIEQATLVYILRNPKDKFYERNEVRGGDKCSDVA